MIGLMDYLFCLCIFVAGTIIYFVDTAGSNFNGATDNEHTLDKNQAQELLKGIQDRRKLSRPQPLRILPRGVDIESHRSQPTACFRNYPANPSPYNPCPRYNHILTQANSVKILKTSFCLSSGPYKPVCSSPPRINPWPIYHHPIHPALTSSVSILEQSWSQPVPLPDFSGACETLKQYGETLLKDCDDQKQRIVEMVQGYSIPQPEPAPEPQPQPYWSQPEPQPQPQMYEGMGQYHNVNFPIQEQLQPETQPQPQSQPEPEPQYKPFPDFRDLDDVMEDVQYHDNSYDSGNMDMDVDHENITAPPASRAWYNTRDEDYLMEDSFISEPQIGNIFVNIPANLYTSPCSWNPAPEPMPVPTPGSMDVPMSENVAPEQQGPADIPPTQEDKPAPVDTPIPENLDSEKLRDQEAFQRQIGVKIDLLKCLLSVWVVPGNTVQKRQTWLENAQKYLDQIKDIQDTFSKRHKQRLPLLNDHAKCLRLCDKLFKEIAVHKNLNGARPSRLAPLAEASSSSEGSQEFIDGDMTTRSQPSRSSSRDERWVNARGGDAPRQAHPTAQSPLAASASTSTSQPRGNASQENWKNKDLKGKGQATENTGMMNGGASLRAGSDRNAASPLPTMSEIEEEPEAQAEGSTSSSGSSVLDSWGVRSLSGEKSEKVKGKDQAVDSEGPEMDLEKLDDNIDISGPSQEHQQFGPDEENRPVTTNGSILPEAGASSASTSRSAQNSYESKMRKRNERKKGQQKQKTTRQMKPLLTKPKGSTTWL